MHIIRTSEEAGALVQLADVRLVHPENRRPCAGADRGPR